MTKYGLSAGLAARPSHWCNSNSTAMLLFAVLSKGVVAVLGPQSQANSDHIKSICDNTEVPFIETRPALTERHQLSSINLHPDPDKMGDILGLYFAYFRGLWEANFGTFLSKEVKASGI